MTQELIKYFIEHGKLERNCSDFTVSDIAAARVKLHTHGVKPCYRIEFEGDKRGKFLENKSHVIYEDLFLKEIFPVFAKSRPETFNFVKLMYQPTAGSYFQDLIKECVTSIFQAGQYTIKTNNEYINSLLGCAIDPKTNRLKYKQASNVLSNFDDFLKSVYFQFLVEEPNGLLFILPIRNGNNTIDNYIPFLVPTIQIYDKNTFWVGDYLIWYENGATYAVNRKTGVTDVFELELSSLCVVSKGVPKGNYFESIFSFALSVANEFERAGVIKEFYDVYLRPEKVTYESIDCFECNGVGSVYNAEKEERHQCKICGGSGKEKKAIKFGDMLSHDAAERQKAVGDSIYEFTTDAIQSLKYYADKYTVIKDEFLKTMFIKGIEAAQSAVAKELDRQRLYKLILLATNVLFDNVTEHVNQIITLLTNGDPVAIIQRPSGTDLKSGTERMQDYKEASAAGLAPTLVNELLISAVKSSDDNDLKAKVDFLIDYDPYYSMTLEQKTKLITLGIIGKYEGFKSLNCDYVLSMLLDKEPTLLVSHEDGSKNLIELMDIQINAMYAKSRQTEMQNSAII